MKTYVEPILEICKFQDEDVVRTSTVEFFSGVVDAEDSFDDKDWE
jgi:hypothetical protein